jgi:hypothetical protein
MPAEFKALQDRKLVQGYWYVYSSTSNSTQTTQTLASSKGSGKNK